MTQHQKFLHFTQISTKRSKDNESATCRQKSQSNTGTYQTLALTSSDPTLSF
jgi:hypothetical protein